MKRAMITALAIGLIAGTGSLSYAQSSTNPGSTGPGSSNSPATMQSPGARAGGAMGQSGMSTAPGDSQAQQIPESEVKSALEQHGYTDVRDVKQRGDKITARAMKDGREQRLEIDTTTGMMRSGG